MFLFNDEPSLLYAAMTVMQCVQEGNEKSYVPHAII
jgi:hypothetical protein